jgi:DNA polymerase-3 subunit delta'
MFDRLTGNKRVKDTVRRMLASGRVPGALMFVGEEGVGKKLFAFELAKALNCLNPDGLEACDTCASCVRISLSKFPEYTTPDDNKHKLVRSDHLDVVLARPYLRVLRIELMREIEREANYRPFEGKARVFVVEDADKLNQQSSNALLKTLEEPPNTSHLVLVTSRPGSLLPTIRSRSQVIRFAALPPSEIEAHLLAGGTASAEDARLLSRIARGSIGRALAFDLETYREQRETMLDLLSAIAMANDRTHILRASEEMNDAKRKDEYESRLDLLSALVRDVWTLSLGASLDQLVNEDLGAQLSGIAPRIESRRAARWLSQIETLRRRLDVNINRKVATDELFLTMAEA